MNFLENRISILREDCELIEDFIRLLDHEGTQKSKKNDKGKRLTLSQIARKSRLEKVHSVLSKSVEATIFIVRNDELVCSHGDTVRRLSDDVEEIGEYLHLFCVNHFSTRKPSAIPDIVITAADVTSDGSKKITLTDQTKDSTGSTSKSKSEPTTDPEISEKSNSVRKTISHWLKLSNIITPKIPINNNYRQTNKNKQKVNRQAGSSGHHGNKESSVLEQQKDITVDGTTVEMYIAKLNNFAERLLLALRLCTSAFEGKSLCVFSKIDRSKSADCGESYERLMQDMDHDQDSVFAWQRINNRHSPFKRSLSFRGRNTVKFGHGERIQVVTTAHIDALRMQLPLTHKNKLSRHYSFSLDK